MKPVRERWSWGIATVGALALTTALPAHASPEPSNEGAYRQVNLVSDLPGRAQVTDPNLVNPWGASYAPTGPLWVSDNETNVSTLYQGGVHGGNQEVLPLVVRIPGGAPTGQVYNPTSEFVVHGSDGSSGPARFIFVGESGHLTGWSPEVPASPPPPSTIAQNAVVTPGAVFKGLAIGTVNTGPRLYAANFSAATVDVYDGRFRRVITSGNFEDPQLPARFAPFNVAVLDGRVYVAYAKQDAEKTDEVAGAGLGRVDVFTLNGKLLARMPQTDVLNAPWGLTLAPAGFGAFSGDLLVGNFGDGLIHVFDRHNLTMVGTLRNAHRTPIRIDGLWALLPGNGVEAGRDEVIFTAGPDDEQHGLLGTLSAIGG